MARKTPINKWYAKYATEHMIIDEDSNGLFYQLLSEADENVLHTVRVDESSAVPVVTSCDCEGHEHGHTCKHMIIATAFIRRIYKSTIAKLEAKEQAAREEALAQAKRDQEKLAAAIQQTPVVVTPVAAAPVITDLSKKGYLYSNQGFSILKR